MDTPALQLPLNGYIRPAQAAPEQAWLLVLMHGVGSNAQDLFSLAPYVPPQFHVLSLQAPYAMGPDAFAWFQFSVNPDGSRTIAADQEQHSLALVAQTVRQAAEQLGVPPERVVVGGFSQGGIMSLSLLLTQPALLHAICVWHSRLLPEVLPLQVPPAQLAGRQVWLSHGTQDNVIPLTSAHLTRARLEPLPVQLRYHEYPCAHTIHPDELRDCVQWLQGLTAAA
ncbi:alpha/beta hydrolase [Comamonas terrigena]|uniref:alpha/beta hydrolase n=1 Tax=Comamonas terrigena TaxID=32013 RepID=UPI0028A73944|nr:dienelactone hydrolase family protein [Comamonas terrigena]